jgi:hypothetical protein
MDPEAGLFPEEHEPARSWSSSVSFTPKAFSQ